MTNLTSQARYSHVESVLCRQLRFRDSLHPKVISIASPFCETRDFSLLVHKVVTHFAIKNIDVLNERRHSIVMAALAESDPAAMESVKSGIFHTTAPSAKTSGVQRMLISKIEDCAKRIISHEREIVVLNSAINEIRNEIDECNKALKALESKKEEPAAVVTAASATAASQDIGSVPMGLNSDLKNTVATLCSHIFSSAKTGQRTITNQDVRKLLNIGYESSAFLLCVLAHKPLALVTKINGGYKFNRHTVLIARAFNEQPRKLIEESVSRYFNGTCMPSLKSKAAAEISAEALHFVQTLVKTKMSLTAAP